MWRWDEPCVLCPPPPRSIAETVLYANPRSFYENVRFSVRPVVRTENETIRVYTKKG